MRHMRPEPPSVPLSPSVAEAGVRSSEAPPLSLAQPLTRGTRLPEGQTVLPILATTSNPLVYTGGSRAYPLTSQALIEHLLYATQC